MGPVGQDCWGGLGVLRSSVLLSYFTLKSEKALSSQSCLLTDPIIFSQLRKNKALASSLSFDQNLKFLEAA